MSISERKLRANRLNSAKSTGPRTEAGKERARANAVKHNLSGEGVVLTSAETDAVAARMVAWKDDYQVDSPSDQWAFEQLVVNSVRVDHCQSRERTMRDYDIHRACLLWEVDQEAGVAVLGSGLARSPEVVAKTLRQSKYGCQWMLEQWNDLGDALASGKTWSDEQLQHALDLLGVPIQARDELVPDDPARLVERETTELQELLDERYEHVDNCERTAAEQGKPIKANKEIARLRRYEDACMKRVRAAQKLLKKRTLDTLEAVMIPEDRLSTTYASPAPPVPDIEAEERAEEAQQMKFFRDYDAAWEAARAAGQSATGIAPTPAKLRDALAPSFTQAPPDEPQAAPGG